MSEYFTSEALIRLGGFLAIIALLVAVQARFPARGDGRPARRQLVNLGLVALDTLMLRLAFPVLAVGWAVIWHERGGGLFGLLDWPLWITIPITLLVLDAAIYWQHRLFHLVPVFWRFHRVHHADTGFDVTTGVRFHPVEIAVSMAIKLGLVTALGPHPGAVLAFEVILSLGSLYTHSDFAFPARLDRRLRWLFVTPSMHRIHHSTWRPETDSNYGFHLSIWDRLFGSYTPAPREDERGMPIGLQYFRAPSDQTLWALLANPFRGRPRPRPESDTDHA